MLDPVKKKAIDQTIIDARMLVLRELGLARELPDDNEKLILLGLGRGRVVAERDEDVKKGTLKERVKKKTKEILIDDELRRRRFVIPSRSESVER